MPIESNDDYLGLSEIFNLVHARWGYTYPTVRKALDRNHIALEANPFNAKQLRAHKEDVQPLLDAREGQITRAEAARRLGLDDRHISIQARMLANIANKYHLKVTPDPWNAAQLLYDEIEIQRIVALRGRARPFRRHAVKAGSAE